jgi:hypothetical protein
MMLSLRTLICLAPILAFGAGTAHAEPFAPIAKTGSAAFTSICPKTSGDATERTTGASTRTRVAFACRCCGWQNWGGHDVCVHQCCD